MARYQYQRAIQVALSCNGDRVDEKDVTFLNIEEDFQGRDLLTFTCPVCSETHKSYRLG